MHDSSFNVKISEIYNNQTLKIHSVPQIYPSWFPSSSTLNIFLDKYLQIFTILWYSSHHRSVSVSLFLWHCSNFLRLCNSLFFSIALQSFLMISLKVKSQLQTSRRRFHNIWIHQSQSNANVTSAHQCIFLSKLSQSCFSLNRSWVKLVSEKAV